MSKYIPKQFSPRIYPEWGELIDDLPVEKQAEIFRAILKYPTEKPKGGIWKFIKSQIDKDYEDFIQRTSKNKEIIRNYWKTKANEGKRSLPIDNDGKPITNNINNNLNNNNLNKLIIKKMNLKENQFYVDDNFSIKKIPEYEIYQKEVGDDILMKVQNWIIDKKKFQVVDKDFICKQIVNFSKRNGLI